MLSRTHRRVNRFVAAGMCVWMSGAAARAQQSSVAVTASMPVQPDALPFPSAPLIVPDSPGVSHPLTSLRYSPLDIPRPLRPQTNENHFAWAPFLTDATRAGVHIAVPQLSQDSVEGFGSGSSFMGGSFVTPTYPRMGGGMRGGRNATDIGSSLLQSLGDSTGGSIGSTLHTLSSLTNSRTGYALSTTGTGVDFHVSGSMGNLMGPTGGGTGQSGVANGLGAPGGHGQGSRGPSLSLKLKF